MSSCVYCGKANVTVPMEGPFFYVEVDPGPDDHDDEGRAWETWVPTGRRFFFIDGAEVTEAECRAAFTEAKFKADVACFAVT